MSSFKSKEPQGIQRHRNVWPSQRKSVNQQKLFLRKTKWQTTRQSLYYNYLKHVQRTKEDVTKNQENQNMS
jgi:hypothetical protein